MHWNREWQPTKVVLPGKSHGQKSLTGYSPWGPKQSDTTEHAHTHNQLKETKDLYSKNYKTLMKKIKDTTKRWKL